MPIRPVGCACPYKEGICAQDGDCYDCPTFKALKLRKFREGDLQ
jgi:hypothetical protein